MFATITAICKICNKEVEQDLDYHSATQTGFSYSCGCRSVHVNNESIWYPAEGQPLVIDETE